jgi:hypothetical protein
MRMRADRKEVVVARKTVDFTKGGISRLPDDKPVVPGGGREVA